MKFLKLQFTEDEFTEIRQYGLYDVLEIGHDEILKYIRQTGEKKYDNKNNNKTTY